jgi:uncharacterized membrane protein
MSTPEPRRRPPSQHSAWRLPAVLCLLALIALSLAWELWLAPLREGGSWLVLKALVLALPLPGITAGRPYTYQWASMLILLFVLEGAVRLMSDTGPTRWLAALELGLSVLFFTGAVGHIRALRRRRPD